MLSPALSCTSLTLLLLLLQCKHSQTHAHTCTFSHIVSMLCSIHSFPDWSIPSPTATSRHAWRSSWPASSASCTRRFSASLQSPGPTSRRRNEQPISLSREMSPRPHHCPGGQDVAGLAGRSPNTLAARPLHHGPTPRTGRAPGHSGVGPTPSRQPHHTGCHGTSSGCKEACRSRFQ